MNPQREQRGGFSVYFLSVLGGILVCLFLIAYFFYGLQPVVWGKGEVQGDTPTKEFSIVKNEGFRDISARLSRESLIKSITVFKLYSFVTGKAQRFQPGVYKLSPSMSIPEIVSTLTEGGKNETEVVIPEGSTLKDIDAILAESHVTKAGEIISFPISEFSATYPYLSSVQSLEGFLFPDTYRFHFNTEPKEVVERLLSGFHTKLWPLLQGRKNWYEDLTLASFLEREVREFEDRRIVAGLLLKRYRIGMPLQVDATLSYAKCEGKFRGCESVKVLRTDTALSSPYNTYQYRGWTPTPIANPGIETVKAAITPLTTPYLYYLSGSDGQTYFSKTLEEHNTKRARYL